MSVKKEKGISLIALVVTIIVLMILAGISIQMLMGDTGIINQTHNANQSKNASEEKEAVEWAASQATGDEDNETGTLTSDNGKNLIDKYLKQYIGEETDSSEQFDYTIYEPGEEVEGENVDLTKDVFVVKFKESENIYIIDQNGTVHKDETSGKNNNQNSNGNQGSENDKNTEITKRDGIILDQGSMDVNNETTNTINITTNASNLKITNSNDSVIELTEKSDQKITFVAKSIGRSTITVETQKGKKARCYVLVHQEPKKINLDVTQIMFDLSENNKEHQVTATIEPSTTNRDTDITWTSSNSNVAEVSSSGNPNGQLKSIGTIKAKSNGTAIITASTKNGTKAICEVTVHTTAQSISMSSTLGLDLSTNNTEKLNVQYNPTTTDYLNKLTWTSSKPNVAKVDQNGNVTGVSNGTTTITAETENKRTTTCEVTVHTTPKAITINKNAITLDISTNSTETLSVTSYNPSTSDIKRGITWSSNNTRVAIVDSTTGKITAKSNGTAIITAKTENGKTASCTVTVHTSPTKITLSGKTILDLTQKNGNKSEKLIVSYEPTTSDIYKDIKWESGNTGIATVSGGTITGVSNGTTTIKATTQNGKTTQCSVTVQTSITSISLNKSSATLDLVGTKTVQLTATINPGSHTEGYYWTSTNSNIASVSNSGYVTGKANGSVTIKAVSSSGKVSASCSITVKTSVVVNSGSTQTSYTLPVKHQERVDTGKEKEHCVRGECEEYKEDCSKKDSITGELICHVTNSCKKYGPDECHMDTVYKNEWVKRSC